MSQARCAVAAEAQRTNMGVDIARSGRSFLCEAPSCGADGCSHVGFVVLVFLRGSSTSRTASLRRLVHSTITTLLRQENNKPKDKTKIKAASLLLKNVNVA